MSVIKGKDNRKEEDVQGYIGRLNALEDAQGYIVGNNVTAQQLEDEIERLSQRESEISELLVGDGGVVGPGHEKWPKKEDAFEHIPLKVESGMDMLYSYVMERMQNCRVYVNFKIDTSRFCAHFIAITTNGSEFHTGEYMTSWLAVGMSDQDKIAREGNLIIKSLSASLGWRIFAEETPTIPKGAIVFKDFAK